MSEREAITLLFIYPPPLLIWYSNTGDEGLETDISKLFWIAVLRQSCRLDAGEGGQELCHPIMGRQKKMKSDKAGSFLID